MSKGSSFSHSSLGEIAKSTALISGGSAVAALIYYYGRKQALRWALENVNTQDKPHPMAVLVLRYLSPRAPKLYDMQEFLPLLPLPSVEDSMRKYLESIRPLVSEDQFRHTKQLVNEFVGSQEARELQAVLETKRETEPNWVAEWWMRFAYLYGRDPLPINVSFAGFDTIFRPAPTNNQALRAAGLIVGTMDFYRRVVLDKDVPCLRMNGLVPVDMDGYRALFGTSRLPGTTCDSIETYLPKQGEPAHIVVIYGSAIYQLQVQRDDGSILSFDEAYGAILGIMKEVESTGLWADPSVPTLTTENRTTWAQVREKFTMFPQNYENLDAINKALFVLSLHEEEAPEDLDRMGSKIWRGDGKRLWYDKSVNLFCFANGRSAQVIEHSFADAPVASHLIEGLLLYEQTKLPNVYEKWDHIDAVPRASPYYRLKWQWNDELEESVDRALKRFSELASRVASRSHIHYAYGKEKIKSYGHPPDAFIQAVLQLTSLRFHGEPVLTYESASTRAFYLGRTETIRSATNEATQFAKSMLDELVTAKERRELLGKATKRHRQITMEAMKGRGVDRHLMGLKLAAITSGREVPKVFHDAAYTQPYRLSTSQTPLIQENTEWLDTPESCGAGGLFGPTAEPGVGCSYHVMKDRLYFHMSARSSTPETDVQAFKDALVKSLSDVALLFEGTTRL